MFVFLKAKNMKGVTMFRIINRFLLSLLMIAFISASTLPATARAALIDTSTYIQKHDTVSVEELKTLVDCAEVRDQLIALGVSPDDALKRIAAMNEAELMAVQQKIDEMAAGGDVLAILGVVLLVLIVLEVLGVTNVFTKL